MRSSSSEISESRFLGSISASSIRNLLPRSMSSKHKSNSGSTKLRNSSSENTPPPDPNIQINGSEVSLPEKLNSSIVVGKSGSQPDELPASILQIKRENSRSDGQSDMSVTADSPVKVVARIRPSNGNAKYGDVVVKKVSSDSLSIGDRSFTFDSIFDSNSNQEDIFQAVGVSLVKDALAGYNASILSYGQSGSGKTYTMWGPPSAIIEDPSPKSHQGIAPRIFQTLFSEIQKEQADFDGKQINYQCRCSFLEIYNEQIGDLLDPTQRNLEIKDDPKNGLYVENLTEEYVTSHEDITQILIKGLSSRKVGATSINSKSSRSHIVFTCVIESWCKDTSSKHFSSSKTSRINLVDLAGPDTNKLDDPSRMYLREGKNVKKSLAQLGYLINALAKTTESGEPRAPPYGGSCLTHILRDSFGGNAKLTVLCTISPDNKNIGETLSTVRFGQRVKLIRNKPVINEITEDDVNDLSDQIRQLKEELIRAKSYASNLDGDKNGYFQGRNVRESLNQLRVSLNRSLMLPRIDNDSEEEVDVDEDDVMELQHQLDTLRKSFERSKEPNGNKDFNQLPSVEEGCHTDITSEDDINCQEDAETPAQPTLSDSCRELTDIASSRGISIKSCRQSPVLEEPTLSESPKIGHIQRKSMPSAPSYLSSHNMPDSSKLTPSGQSVKPSELIRSSLQSSKGFSSPTESLAASLQRGLQIIDYHQRSSASQKSSVSFSFGHLTLKPCLEADEANNSAHGLSVKRDESPSFLCASCRQRQFLNDSKDVRDSLKKLIVAVDESGNPIQVKDQVFTDAKDERAGAIKRHEEREKLCMDQAAKIEQLTKLVEQYKNARGVENEIVLFENNQPEIANEKCEIKEVQEEFSCVNRSAFDSDEKEALLKEIQSLRSKLQSYADAPPNKSTEKLRSSLLSRSVHLRNSAVDFHSDSREELERERERWMEMESDWISLTDELRVDIESKRQHAEEVEMELRLEKKCTEELDDALQRAVLGHARMVEHYTELQEKYNELLGRNRTMSEWVAEVKKAVVKAGSKGNGTRFSKSLASELSALRVERERERELLKRENKSLKIQLRDTADAVHAAGELLVRLREAEHTTSVAEENLARVQEENDKLKKQVEKIKRKHKMEMITMKQYLAESRLPESALQPLYREDSDVAQNAATLPYDDQAWRAEFGAIYQDHY